MRLFNTAAKNYIKFQPPKEVGMYVCGITPYDAAHMGHIFTFLTYDLLQRRLEDKGHTVRLVRNVTDVDEPIYKRARETGTDYRELALRETEHFQSVLKTLNFRPAHAEPKASEYIQEMAEAVQALISSGIAYKLENDIYFDIASQPEFGSFSGFNERLRSGLFKSRGGDPERPGKRQPADFLLWKGVIDKSDPAQWNTVVGIGRPGWHIECSVMSKQLLGIPFTLHGGGTDLVFPHHECEVAQSRALGDGMPADIWVHVSPLLHDGEKMSKSLGNLVFAADVLSEYDAPVVRLALMHYHHRIGGEWQPELLDSARLLWQRLEHARQQMSKSQAEQLLADVRCALDDDLNTTEVIDAIHYATKTVDSTSNPDTRALPVLETVYTLLGLPF